MNNVPPTSQILALSAGNKPAKPGFVGNYIVHVMNPDHKGRILGALGLETFARGSGNLCQRVWQPSPEGLSTLIRGSGNLRQRVLSLLPEGLETLTGGSGHPHQRVWSPSPEGLSTLTRGSCHPHQRV